MNLWPVDGYATVTQSKGVNNDAFLRELFDNRDRFCKITLWYWPFHGKSKVGFVTAIWQDVFREILIGKKQSEDFRSAVSRKGSQIMKTRHGYTSENSCLEVEDLQRKPSFFKDYWEKIEYAHAVLLGEHLRLLLKNAGFVEGLSVFYAWLQHVAGSETYWAGQWFCG